jgi:hypothetical protein
VYQGSADDLLSHMKMITPGIARSLTPTQFVERPEREPRHAREHHPVLAVRQALAHLAHSLRHPRLRHVGH